MEAAFFGKIKNVRLDTTNIKNKELDDIEISECIVATFTYYGKTYGLKCEVLLKYVEESQEVDYN